MKVVVGVVRSTGQTQVDRNRKGRPSWCESSQTLLPWCAVSDLLYGFMVRTEKCPSMSNCCIILKEWWPIRRLLTSVWTNIVMSSLSLSTQQQTPTSYLQACGCSNKYLIFNHKFKCWTHLDLMMARLLYSSFSFDHKHLHIFPLKFHETLQR